MRKLAGSWAIVLGRKAINVSHCSGNPIRPFAEFRVRAIQFAVQTQQGNGAVVSAHERRPLAGESFRTSPRCATDRAALARAPGSRPLLRGQVSFFTFRGPNRNDLLPCS